MNGVDWDASAGQVRQARCRSLGHREDLNYVIGEIQGELSNSHTYVGGGDLNDDVQPVPTGLLGADYGLDAKSGRYFIQKIYAGDNTRHDYASPLSEPGLDVHEGDYLLAVDGHELKAPTDIYSLFVGSRGRTVTLTVADDAAGKGNARRDGEDPARRADHPPGRLDQAQPRSGGQGLRRQDRLRLPGRHGRQRHEAVHRPVLPADRQAGPDHRRALQRRRLHRPDPAGAAAPRAGGHEQQPRARGATDPPVLSVQLQGVPDQRSTRPPTATSSPTTSASTGWVR